MIQAADLADNEVFKLLNAQKSILQKDTDPERMKIFTTPPEKFDSRQRALIWLNDWLQRDINTFQEINSKLAPIRERRAMLDNDYRTLYWEALAWSNTQIADIQRQTDQLLAWSAQGQLRDQWFALWQATAQWATQAMKDKVSTDINQQGSQQRQQIIASQADRLLQARWNKQQLQIGVGQQLQQQQQQDFQNNLTLADQALREAAMRLSTTRSSRAPSAETVTETIANYSPVVDTTIPDVTAIPEIEEKINK